MEHFTGLIGIAAIMGIAYLLSNNKKAIDYRLVGSGLLIQLLLALFILKTPLGEWMFARIGSLVEKVLKYAMVGGDFVFGFLTNSVQLNKMLSPLNGYIFVVQLIPSIVFVAVLVSLAYHFGIMQRIVAVIAKIVHRVMGVSGSEALSNVASAFVGQVEAQIMIKPYVPTMTMSELLASMAGSMACIAGGVMAVYIGMGIPAKYLLAASIMAAPGALVISKIVYPETEVSETKGKVNLSVEKHHVNFIDAISHGASDGMKISINVVAMLIGFLALIAAIDGVLGFTGRIVYHQFGSLYLDHIGINLAHLSIKDILGSVFSLFAILMGVPFKDAHFVGSLMGTKMALNEFVAYADLAPVVKGVSDMVVSHKAVVIASFALCGFANIGSIGIQVGGIGELAPSRRSDLAKLGVRALICGTLASYLSATIAGIITSF